MPVFRDDVPEDGWNVEYFAAKGDTLKLIAARYKIDSSNLQLSNYPVEGDGKLRIDIQLPAGYALWLPTRLFSRVQQDVSAARAGAASVPVAVTTATRAGEGVEPSGQSLATAVGVRADLV